MKPYFLFLPIPVLLLTSCGSEPARRAAESPTPPAAVQTAVIATQDWPASYEATGTVRARTTATISSKVMGYVQQVNAQVGDHVRQGQVLITLDARDPDVSLCRAEAGRAEVESAIPELENATAAAKANLDLAQTTFQRMQELAAKKSISNQELDKASARLKAAQANYEVTRSRRAQVSSKTAVVEQEVRAAGIMRDYARLAAPFAGVVITRTVEPGIWRRRARLCSLSSRMDSTAWKRRWTNPGSPPCGWGRRLKPYWKPTAN
jgi:membrane fusion protein, multidrug efflux system